MNEAKVTEYLGNIFHLETCIGENGNYELSSNYWDLKFNVRVREFTVFIQDGLGARCSIDSDEDETTIAREIVGFVGDVLKDISKTFVYDGTSGILAWPYNCNLVYVNYLKEAMDMGADENLYEYKARKAGLNSSKEPIKSDSDWHARHDYQNKEIYREAFGSLVKDSDAQDFDNSPYGTVHYPGFYRVLVDGTYETEFSAETDEEAIQKFKDYFAETRGIRNSRNPIKSSFDVLYDYIDKGVFWEDVEDYADQLIQEGKFTLDEYNSEKGKLREYFNNEEKKAKKTSWENEGRENGFLNSSRNQLSLDKIFS